MQPIEIHAYIRMRCRSCQSKATKGVKLKKRNKCNNFVHFPHHAVEQCCIRQILSRLQTKFSQIQNRKRTKLCRMNLCECKVRRWHIIHPCSSHSFQYNPPQIVPDLVSDTYFYVCLYDYVGVTKKSTSHFLSLLHFDSIYFCCCYRPSYRHNI